MLIRKSIVLLVILGLSGAAGVVRAGGEDSGDNGTTKEKTFLGRIDDFGKSIFNGIFPSDKSKTKSSSSKSQRQRPDRARSDDELSSGADSPRAGSILAGPPSAEQRSAEAMEKINRDAHNKAVKPARRATVAVAPSDEVEEAAPPPAATAKLARRVNDDTSELLSDLAVPAEPQKPEKSVSPPLHERLEGFRKSAFEEEADSSPPAPAREVPTAPPPRAEGRPVIAQRATPAWTPDRVVSDAPAEAVDESRPTKASKGKVVVSDGDEGVLFARKGPQLSVETIGPRTISVGRQSTYEVHIVNSGEVAAEDLIVFVALPEWAEVARAEAGVGEVHPPVIPTASAPNPAAGTVQWKLGVLGAKSRERLTLRIIPRQSRPFDLAVRWEYKPVASQTMIEVQEPKLSMQLSGPREVLYGKKEHYRLKLTNTGNGNAENVVLTLMPLGAGENVPATQKIGLLAPGEEKNLDVELTARQAGNLLIQMEARADGGIRAELAEKVLVRRADLKVDLEGPKVQFLGTVATYTVRVRNPGTAAAKSVRLALTLPVGAKYLSGIDGARFDPALAKLDWALEDLSPGTEKSFTLKCSLGTAGMSRVQVAAAAADDLATSSEIVVRVESVANLTMEVKDPVGPVPVGDEAVYELRIRNRGTREAQGVEVMAYFSRGVEPTAAEGVENRLGPGEVVFQPIASLAPGEEVVLKVRAKAEIAGNHVFRAEAHCKPLGSRLVREATNLYYGDGPAVEQAAREPAGGPK